MNFYSGFREAVNTYECNRKSAGVFGLTDDKRLILLCSDDKQYWRLDDFKQKHDYEKART